MQTGECPVPFVQSLPQSPDPLVPVLATRAGTVVSIFFNRTLKQGPLNAANWSAIYLGTKHPGVSAVSLGTHVRLVVSPFGSGSFPGESVTYEPPPFDVVALVAAEKAPAFDRFGIT